MFEYPLTFFLLVLFLIPNLAAYAQLPFHEIARPKLKKNKKLRTYPFSKLICTCMIPISLWLKTVDPDSLHLGLHFICQRATKKNFFIEAFFPLRSCECSYRARSCQSRVYYTYICSWRYTFVFAATAICDVNLCEVGQPFQPPPPYTPLGFKTPGTSLQT